MAAGISPQDDSYTHFQQRWGTALITTYVFAMMAVPLKLWCRNKTRGWRKMGLEELFTVVAALFVSAVFWIFMVALRPLVGKHLADIFQSPSDLARFPAFGVWNFTYNMLYVPTLCFLKLSILALYWTLFGLDRRTQAFLMTIGGVLVAWLIALCLVYPFSCRPIAAAWDLKLAATAKCIPTRPFFIGGSLPNVLTDIVLVITPLPYVWRLHAPLGQRIILACMFSLGAFVCVVSIVRFAVLVDAANNSDVTYALKDVYPWSIVELNVGLVCACLPSLRPLARVIGLGSLFSSSSHSRDKSSNARGAVHPGGFSNDMSGHLASRRKPNGFFTAFGGGTVVGEEDEFEMINRTEGGTDGKGTSQPESSQAVSRVSHDTDAVSHESAASRINGALDSAIKVQKGWSVSHTQP